MSVAISTTKTLQFAGQLSSFLSSSFPLQGHEMRAVADGDGGCRDGPEQLDCAAPVPCSPANPMRGLRSLPHPSFPCDIAKQEAN